MSDIEEKYRLINDNERAIERYRNIVFYFTFIAYANSHLSRKCYTNLKVYDFLQATICNCLNRNIRGIFVEHISFSLLRCKLGELA
jgi:hypothetical protein